METAKAKLIKGATGDWEVVIGMEVHAQVASNAKLFSGASTEFGGAPNDHVSLVDAAMPGMLPVINEECVNQAVRTGLGLKAKINLKSVFDRKNYFYPDLPQGYQISQYKQPVVGEGEVIVDLPDGSFTVGIERLHLEQDAGKSLHDRHPTMSYVDLNRSGVALMEIVSKPDIRSSEQAKAYVTKLRSILRYLGTCDGDMEKGSLRADVNVSVRKPGAPLGTRCEIKNMNSISFIGDAIEHEARRQIEIIEDGGTIDQETRLYDPGKRADALDALEGRGARLSLFPRSGPAAARTDAGRGRCAEGEAAGAAGREEGALRARGGPLGLRRRRAGGRARNGRLLRSGREGPRRQARGELGDQRARRPAEQGGQGHRVLAGHGRATRRRARSDQGRIDLRQDRQGSVRDRLVGRRRSARDRRGARHEAGHRHGAIEKVIDEIIAANPDKVAQAKAKPQLAGWFVGQVMKASGGKANPQAVNDLLKAKLGI